MLGQCLQEITGSHGLALGLFLAGLAGGFTHCVGMCSPFVLAQVQGDNLSLRRASGFMFAYHLGRMTSYVALAVLVNTAVNLAFVFSDLKNYLTAPLLLLAAVIFISSAFPWAAAVFPWAAQIRISIPYRFISGAFSRLVKKTDLLSRYALGVLLGFMPCGLVAAALLASAAAPNAAMAAVAMAAFALGTVPALLIVALGGHALAKKYPHAAANARRGAMMLSGLWLFLFAGAMIL